MPLFWLCIAFILGLFSSAYLPLPEYLWLLVFILFTCGSWLEKAICKSEYHPLLSRPLFRIPVCLIAAFFALGAWRFQAALPEFSEDDLAWYPAKENITLIGQVSSYPQESSSSTVAIVEAQSIDFRGNRIEINGKLEVRLPAGFNLAYGDVLLLEGSLESVSESESKPFQSYLARKGIYNRMYYPDIRTIGHGSGNWLIGWIYSLRDKSLQRIYDQIPFPESTLLSGILLGIDWIIPSFYQDAYRSCGLIHIIAISGFNIALISNVIIKITRRFLSVGKAGIVAIVAIFLYTLFVGAEPAVVRAALMGCLAIPSHFLGRRVIPIHSLLIVGVLMLVGNPFLLWDVSFQLSFLACLGLITMADPIQSFISKMINRYISESASNWLEPINVLIITTLVAQFAVMPVTLNMDTRISMATLAANITVLPVQPILMGLGALSMITGWFLPDISSIFSRAVWPLLSYCNRLALHFGFLPGAEADLPPNSNCIAFVIIPPVLLLFLVLHIRKIEDSQIIDQNGH